ncbi:hypothetical protein [Saccharopolyspora spinosa]|uniref:Uncharacterized protein n=1 Tax=Saccharopolyspora spinosa TaxID=60894 RepID=A0A2N3Y1R4_SACSN|nr:hypothetical protein [Saccharopolyspora spinosa]PKW16845.1 hypothetical protein A8926_4740 [Saccharopolyspora spinosa]
MSHGRTALAFAFAGFHREGLNSPKHQDHGQHQRRDRASTAHGGRSRRVSITEALRRLVGYGDLVYRATKVDGSEVLIRRGKELERIHLV